MKKLLRRLRKSAHSFLPCKEEEYVGKGRGILEDKKNKEKLSTKNEYHFFRCWCGNYFMKFKYSKNKNT